MGTAVRIIMLCICRYRRCVRGEGRKAGVAPRRRSPAGVGCECVCVFGGVVWGNGGGSVEQLATASCCARHGTGGAPVPRAQHGGGAPASFPGSAQRATAFHSAHLAAQHIGIGHRVLQLGQLALEGGHLRGRGAGKDGRALGCVLQQALLENSRMAGRPNGGWLPAHTLSPHAVLKAAGGTPLQACRPSARRGCGGLQRVLVGRQSMAPQGHAAP